jgi:hypothetical protein
MLRQKLGEIHQEHEQVEEERQQKGKVLVEGKKVLLEGRDRGGVKWKTVRMNEDMDNMSGNRYNKSKKVGWMRIQRTKRVLTSEESHCDNEDKKSRPQSQNVSSEKLKNDESLIYKPRNCKNKTLKYQSASNPNSMVQKHTEEIQTEMQVISSDSQIFIKNNLSTKNLNQIKIVNLSQYPSSDQAHSQIQLTSFQNPFPSSISSPLHPSQSISPLPITPPLPVKFSTQNPLLSNLSPKKRNRMGSKEESSTTLLPVMDELSSSRKFVLTQKKRMKESKKEGKKKWKANQKKEESGGSVSGRSQHMQSVYDDEHRE